MTRSSTACWNTDRFGWLSTMRADRGAVQRAVRLRAGGAHRRALGGIERAPLDAGASAARPIAPPSASISRTRWPLPMPPIAGLQLIAPTVSMLWVSSSVRAPSRAAASAASVPAWPPPITITS
jgi:hypothetical protein